MSDVNRSKVKVALRDVGGKLLTDSVEFKFYNQRAQSLNQVFRVEFKGRPAALPNVPAFPFGLAEVFINPTKYRYKSIFLNVPAGKEASIDETCFVEPEEVEPVFPVLSEIQKESRWVELWRILQASGIKTATAWKELDDLQKAGLLNLFAKAQDQTVKDGRPIASFIERITDFRPSRIFAIVASDLFGLVHDHASAFHPVSGALHKFPNGWKPIDPEGSFKTYDKAGNLQITFAQDSAGKLMVDMDIDDHQGIEHAADVLKHKITGKDTHPYDIHEILIYFQGLDLGYELV